MVVRVGYGRKSFLENAIKTTVLTFNFNKKQETMDLEK
jgi:hypothetical protein